MVCRILNDYGTCKADVLLEHFTSAVVDFDPRRASRAELTFMQAELNTFADRLTKVEAEAQREYGETEELQQTYHRYLYAAHILQQELDQAGDSGRRMQIENSLVSLVEQLERLQPELAREQGDDRAFAAWTSSLRSAFETLAQRLSEAQNDLPPGKQRMKERAIAASTLTTALSAISVALDSMNRNAAKIREEREAFESKLEGMRSGRLEHDPNIAAALGTRELSVSVDVQSLRRRLARLETPIAEASASAA